MNDHRHAADGEPPAERNDKDRQDDNGLKSLRYPKSGGNI